MGVRLNPFTAGLQLYNTSGGGGGSTDSFVTIQTDYGTSPTAGTSTSTLTLTSSDSSLTITGNSGTDTINFQITAANTTITSASALTTASNLVTVGTITTGTWNGTTIAIAHGGTGATTAAAAFTNLSPLTTAGDIIYENNTPAPARLPIGTTGQVLTVVSGLPAWSTMSGSGTVTTVSVVSANGFAGTVANATSTPAITISTTLNTPVIAGNGTALIAATTTGTGSTVVLNTSPTLVTPALGTPSALVGTNITGTASGLTAGNTSATSNSTITTLTALSLPGSQVTGNISGNAANVTGTVAVGNGGTGDTSFTPYAVVTGGVTSGGALQNVSGVGTTGQVLTSNGASALPTWQTTSGTGTVTSVALTVPGVIFVTPVSGSPITTSGTLALALNTQTANTVLAGPTTGSAATPTFRALVAADIPTITASQVGGFTSGSVIFAGSGGTLSQDNANFFWNDTNYSLGLGTATPASNTFIDGVNTSGATKRIQLTGYGTSSFVGYRGRFARGTLGTPAAAQSGDTLNFVSGQGYGTSTFPTGSTGAINFVAGETFTNTSNATYLQFEVTPTASTTIAEAMRLNSTGDLLIATTTDDGVNKLQVNGGTKTANLTATGTTTLATTLTGVLQATSGVVSTATTTGTGNVVLSTSPALTSPSLDTPTAITLTNATGLPLTTGVTGTLPIANGGTNATTVSGARSSLGIDAGETFITSGTTYTTPSTITTSTQFKFTLVGGGGAGSGTLSTAAAYQAAGGGGAGGVGIVYLTGLSPSTAYTIAIGSGGAGASGAVGSAGGNTTLTALSTTYTASGGSAPASTSENTNGGAGGTTTNCTVGLTGQAGGQSAGASQNVGGFAGGSNQWGQGAQAVIYTSTGNTTGATATAGYGGGGSGSRAGAASITAGTGGSGAAGMILVEYWN